MTFLYLKVHCHCALSFLCIGAMAEFTQDDFDENIALKTKATRAVHEYLADCSRIKMPTVAKFMVFNEVNATTNNGNENKWIKMNLSPPSQNLASCSGSRYGSNSSLSSRASSRASSRSSGFTTPQLRDVAAQLQSAQRMAGSPLPMDVYPPAEDDNYDELVKMVKDSAEKQKEIMDCLQELTAKKKK